MLFPDLAPSPRALSACRRGAARFVAAPLSICAGIGLLTAASARMARQWADFILFTGLMALVPALFFLAVRLADYRTGGVAVNGGAFTLRYSRGLYLHTVVVERDKLAQVKFSQSLWQRRGATCDLLVRTRGEGKILHRCRAVDMAGAKELFA